jgi:hypothetical protein
MQNNANITFEELAIKDTIARNQALRQRKLDTYGNLSVVRYNGRNEDSGLRVVLLANGTPKNVRNNTNSEPNTDFTFSYTQGTTASGIGSIDTKPA